MKQGASTIALFAEGPTDERFLPGVIGRVVTEILDRKGRGSYDVYRCFERHLAQHE